MLAAFSIRKILGLETETAERYIGDRPRRAQELQQLSARLVEAQENERRSISRELHDEVGQALTGVLVEMANLSTRIRSGDRCRALAKADEIKALSKTPSAWFATWPCCCAPPCSTISASCPLSNGRPAKSPSAPASG